jgi:hypothetical protein
MITPDSLVTMINRGKAPVPGKGSTDVTVKTSTTPDTASKPPRISRGYDGMDIFKVNMHHPDKVLDDAEDVTMLRNRALHGVWVKATGKKTGCCKTGTTRRDSTGSSSAQPSRN